MSAIPARGEPEEDTVVTETLTPDYRKQYKIWQIIGASAAGTMIEWYDFYIFGSLGAIISPLYYPTGNELVAFLAFLATFATGFAVRPFGAIIFGRIGDVVGRKYAFLVTLLLMGGATTVIGIVPTYATIGIAAPIILVLLRLIQGLALGGEYGGAAVYVAEHVPDNKRGFYTAFIQTTATLGLFLSLGVILIVRLSLSKEAFATWGWRIPFLLSILLVGLSVVIRLRMSESPIFAKLKEKGKTSAAPLREAFVSKRNWKIIFTVLFGAAAGQAVVWYTGQFYALFFLQGILKVDFVTANIVVAVALAIGTPFFIVFGALSDKIGRKKIMMTGNLVAAILTYPIFQAMAYFAGPVDPATKTAINANAPMLTLMVFILVFFVTMVYGPIAAFLVEAFPARIRYTSLSLPYHVANGYFGGFTPLIATSLVAATGSIYAGLIFPITVAALTFVIGSLILQESRHVSIWGEAEEHELHPAWDETETAQAG
jgi:MFS family permease